MASAILLAQIDVAMAGMAILGLVAGYCLGARLRSIDPTSPAWCAVGGAVLAMVFARLILWMLLLGGAAYLLWRGRSLLRDCAVAFSHGAGSRWRRYWESKGHGEKVRRIQREHEKRLEAIYEADIPARTRARLEEQEEARFDRELQELHRSS